MTIYFWSEVPKDLRPIKVEAEETKKRVLPIQTPEIREIDPPKDPKGPYKKGESR